MSYDGILIIVHEYSIFRHLSYLLLSCIVLNTLSTLWYCLFFPIYNLFAKYLHQIALIYILLDVWTIVNPKTSPFIYLHYANNLFHLMRWTYRFFNQLQHNFRHYHSSCYVLETFYIYYNQIEIPYYFSHKTIWATTFCHGIDCFFLDNCSSGFKFYCQVYQFLYNRLLVTIMLQSIFFEKNHFYLTMLEHSFGIYCMCLP